MTRARLNAPRPEQGRPASNLLRDMVRDTVAVADLPVTGAAPELIRRYLTFLDSSVVRPAIANAFQSGARIPGPGAGMINRNNVDEIDRRFLAFMELIAQQMELRLRTGEVRWDGAQVFGNLTRQAPGALAQELVAVLKASMGLARDTVLIREFATLGMAMPRGFSADPKLDPDNRVATLEALDKDGDGRIDAATVQLPIEVVYALNDALIATSISTRQLGSSSSERPTVGVSTALESPDLKGSDGPQIDSQRLLDIAYKPEKYQAVFKIPKELTFEQTTRRDAHDRLVRAAIGNGPDADVFLPAATEVVSALMELDTRWRGLLTQEVGREIAANPPKISVGKTVGTMIIGSIPGAGLFGLGGIPGLGAANPKLEDPREIAIRWLEDLASSPAQRMDLSELTGGRRDVPRGLRVREAQLKQFPYQAAECLLDRPMTAREAERVFGAGTTPRKVQEYARMSLDQFLEVLASPGVSSVP